MAISFDTVIVSNQNGQLSWPNEVPTHAYVLIYEHSKLQFQQSVRSINANTLYDAWAFDGTCSWHIWQNDHDEWVCTKYDTRQVHPDQILVEEQLLNIHFKEALNRTKLLIHRVLEYDQDDQAYVSYACPIAVA